MLSEFQILDDIGTKRPACLHRVGGETIAKGLCHYGAAYDGAAFEDQNFFALFGEIGRRDQSIMSCTNDDGIVVVCHKSFPFNLLQHFLKWRIVCLPHRSLPAGHTEGQTWGWYARNPCS